MKQPRFKMGEKVQVGKSKKIFTVNKIEYSKALETYIYSSEYGPKKESDLTIVAGFQLITPKIYVYSKVRSGQLVFKIRPDNENQFLKREPALEDIFNGSSVGH